MIDRFKIFGLHHRQNVDLRFDSPFNILLSENGRGKTTILNTLYAVLMKDINRLQKLDFESISISFTNAEHEKIEISKDKIQYKWDSRAYDFFHGKLRDDSFNWLINAVVNGSTRRQIVDFLQESGEKINLTALRDLMEEKDSLQESMQRSEFFDAVARNFDAETLYLTTYRRVEENIENLGVDKNEFKGTLINFGLDDVTQRIESIRNEILELSNSSFNSVSGSLLTKMINGLPVDNEAKQLINNQRDLVPLILSRVGKTLSEQDRLKIIRLVDSGEIFTSNDDSLAYFLAELISAYQKQKNLDESLKKYAQICKDYFTNKNVVYDENRIHVDFLSIEPDELLDVNLLSSGEKQIASLFADIYLNQGRPLAILFDEPELSLSVEWQERLLKDIIDSNRCKFLLAMTHSPFIFKNLTNHTSDLSQFLSRAK